MKLPSATCDAPTATVAKLRSRLGGFGMALLTQPDVPAARNGTQGRHLFNDPNVKHGTDARAKRASIGTNVRAIGFGVASPIARSNHNQSTVGFKRLLRASFYAATQTIGVNRAPSLEMVIGVAAPFNAAFLAEPNPHLRKHANKHGQQTGAANMRASREKFARVAGNAQAIPASNAAPFHSARLTPRAPSPAAAGIFFFAMRELMAGAR